MKRYALFAGDGYTPCGGWSDFKGSFDSVGDAKREAYEVCDLEQHDWWQVVDLQSGTIVSAESQDYRGWHNDLV